MNYLDIAREQLRIDEGARAKPYTDTVGKTTIGVGRNLTDVGLSEDEIELLFVNDVARADAIARSVLHGFDGLTEPRKAIVVNMAFNMGRGALSQFRKTLAAIEEGRYEDAAREMLDSKWAGQVGNRALRLAENMRRG